MSIENSKKNEAIARGIAYSVPAKFVVTVLDFCSPKSLDKPKSAIFGIIMVSISMF